MIVKKGSGGRTPSMVIGRGTAERPVGGVSVVVVKVGGELFNGGRNTIKRVRSIAAPWQTHAAACIAVH